MPQSLVLEWLNENEFRSYPLRLVANKELIIAGIGSISLGSEVSGQYLVNGKGTSFLSQITVGDLLEVGDSRATIMVIASDSTLYVDTDLRPTLGAALRDFFIVKKNNSLDSEADTVNITLDNIILDANLIYYSTPTSLTDVGKLMSITVSGVNLQIAVYEQATFTVPNYLTATYPYYARNADGSLLVLGKAAKNIKTNLSFLNQQFEISTVTLMDQDWHGVSSLSFNGVGDLTGVVTFYEGYQVDLAVPAVNTLKIGANQTFGTPIVCDRIYGDEVEADCTRIISYINSVTPNNDFGDFKLVAGNHIAIYPDPDNHRIYVGLNFEKTDICSPFPIRPVTQI